MKATDVVNQSPTNRLTQSGWFGVQAKTFYPRESSHKTIENQFLFYKSRGWGVGMRNRPPEG
jgi:hypothetical protein